jgi:hypothetical protein
MRNRKITTVLGAALLGLVLGCDDGNEAIAPTSTPPPPAGNPGGSFGPGGGDQGVGAGQLKAPKKPGN